MAPPLRYDVLADLRRELAVARRADLPFDDAWDVAWAAVTWPGDGVTRRMWKEALRATRNEWNLAYVREPSRSADVLVALLTRLQPEAPAADEFTGAPRVLA